MVKVTYIKTDTLKKADFKNLVERYLDGHASKEEIDLLFKYYDNMQDPGFLWDDSAMGDQSDTRKVLYDRILKDIGKKKPHSLSWVKIAAAVLILLSCGLLLSRNYYFQQPTAHQQPKNEIFPGGNNAILTLANGSRIILNNLKQGKVMVESGFKITKTSSGQLIYEILDDADKVSSRSEKLNTITTPKGGQFQIILPDGTKVWLNAASSLTYPMPFDEKGRIVELSGEAYFEVAKLDLKDKTGKVPFTVKINTPSGNLGNVEVLGTHFNIMAYHDEQKVTTTLMEGSVKVQHGSAYKLLRPGQQSNSDIGGSNTINITDNVSMEEVLAWKNEQFDFNNVNVKTIMRQISRWYDVDIQIVGELPLDNFRGKISRNEPLSQVLKVLKLNGVNLRMEGRTIIVKP